jgi:hypothetical protein
MSRERLSRIDPAIVKKLYAEIDLDGDGLVQRSELIKVRMIELSLFFSFFFFQSVFFLLLTFYVLCISGSPQA